MTPERWARVQEVFAEAIEQQPAEREGFLQSACRGDPELRKEVETLLVSHERASSNFLVSPALETPAPSRRSLSPGNRLGPYEILGSIGAGGMGEVYRARDRKLDRDVAIKVLPQSVASDPDALGRFEREAKAVAALSHPNILSIFDFGTADGVAYAVTELLEGEALRAKLASGPIAPKQAIDYALQIARGLSAAHERHIVHRDLKPENLFVTKDGHVKILDFGLAKRVETAAPGEESSAPTESGRTIPGTVMGTIGYMSPEQVRGLPVDHRSDIFSFGTILYEMLWGKRAFKRATAADTMSAILKEEPAELELYGRTAPSALEQIVRHCLEKDRESRFQSARDLALALADASTSATQTPFSPKGRSKRLLWATALVLATIAAVLLWERIPSRPRVPSRAKTPRIVVLPFENLGAPEEAYFAAGMTDEIINRLANLHELAVISRATAIGYDRKGKTIKQIGADLGVDFVLEGTVRWEHGAGRDSRVRITPELVQVADDTHLWGGRYERVMSDIFAIQSEVGENVVRAMGIKLVPRESTVLKAVSTSDMEAYDFYLRGLQMANRSQTKQDQEGAVQMLQAAVDRDPQFTQALAQLAKAHVCIYFYRFDRSPAHVEKAKEAVDRLAFLGPDLFETHLARAYYRYWGLLEYPAALEEFKAALTLQPSSSEVLEGISYVLRRQGRWQESAEQTTKWLELDPRNPLALFQHGSTCVLLRRYAEADRVYSLSVSLNPRSGPAWGRRGWLQILWRGDVEKALSILSQAQSIPGLQDDPLFRPYGLFRVALIRRDIQGALLQLERDARGAFYTQFWYFPLELLRGQAQALGGQQDSARRSFEVARLKLEQLTREKPDDDRYSSALGITRAGLGLREAALEAARRGVELMPQSKDAWKAMFRIEDLALVYAMLGQQKEAIDQLEFLLAHTGEFSTHVLRLDPRWEPLKTNPRFQALLAKYPVKP